MKWTIITAEFPPQPGGVSDYTYQLAQALASGTQDETHVLAPESDDEATLLPQVRVHRLPKGFGPRWLLALDRALKKAGSDGTILVQYVPHGYGWKAMNLAFCIWLLRQRHRRVFVMFHEVAYRFRNRQPLRHDALAAVHRPMARLVLASAERSFTSIEPIAAFSTGWRPAPTWNCCGSVATSPSQVLERSTGTGLRGLTST